MDKTVLARKGFWGRLCLTLLFIVSLGLPAGASLAEGNQDPQVEYHKTIAPLKDSNGQVVPDKHELTLDFLSHNGQNIQAQPLDVVFVADLSGSMGFKDGGAKTRLEILKDVLNGQNGNPGVVDALLKNPQNRISVVGFGGKIDNNKGNWPERDTPFSIIKGVETYDDGHTFVEWQSDKTTVKNKIQNMPLSNRSYGNQIVPGAKVLGTGTNIQAGLQEVETLLGTSRANAKKVVILFSDGFANMFYRGGYTLFNYNNGERYKLNGRLTVDRFGNPVYREDTPQWFSDMMGEALSGEIAKIAPKIHGFYSVKFRYTNNTDSIQDIKGYISAANSSIPNEVYSANDQNELKTQLEDIARKIVPVGIREVTITDVLSKYVQLPEGAAKIRLVKLLANGAEEALPEGSFHVVESKDENGLVKLTAQFDPSFSIEDNVRYALRFTIESSQAAKDAIAGDGTVTGADAAGGQRDKLYSNQSASISYKFGLNGQEFTGGGDYTRDQVFSPSKPYSTTVRVNWLTANGQPLRTPPQKQIEVSLTQKGKDGGQDKPDYRKIRVDTSKATAKIDKVAQGYTYEIRGPEVANFIMQPAQGTGEGDLTLTYREKPSIKIIKNVDDGNTSGQFSVTVQAYNNQSQWLTGTYGKLTVGNVGSVTVPLTYNKQTRRYEGELPHLPLGLRFRIADNTPGYENSYNGEYVNLPQEGSTVTINSRRLPSLTIHNKVEGVFANYLQEFPIQISLKNPDNSPFNGNRTITRNGKNETITFKDGLATISLGRNGTAVLADLPFGTNYEVTENQKSALGYQITYSRNSKGKLNKKEDVTVTNTRRDVPPTGIGFIATPAMLLLMLVFGAILFILILIQSLKRRRYRRGRW